MKSMIIGGMVMLLVASDVWADGDQPPVARPKLTETWLQLQASGKAASPTPQSNTPLERDLSLQRWLETYQYKIPEHYEQEAGGSFSSKDQ
ncbi:DUF3613 domain-containing protein [Pseudomonas syringae group genomosp. 7]|uniref:TraO protein n=1 Tax=Pseudomonas syringae pv. tagetis TaxID=129140 RepID=A0A0Q0BTP1_9PSED|nr:DUF3613 domain-containing protein [Pseudomonas syringae group genomosp. 7]KPY81714.1 hypothetical protein ALO44_200205 [Pseudomonas syringae pv. tagetis]